MICISTAFINIVTTLYTYCISISHPGKVVLNLSWVFELWFVMFTTGTLMIIYHSSLLTTEVIKCIRPFNIWIIMIRKNLNFLQGRNTFKIVHDIQNCCNDLELMQSVINSVIENWWMNIHSWISIKFLSLIRFSIKSLRKHILSRCLCFIFILFLE